MITTLRVSAGFDDKLEAVALRIWSLDRTVLFDSIQVDITGVGSGLYDRLQEMSLRAPVEPYAPWESQPLANYSAGLLKK